MYGEILYTFLITLKSLKSLITARKTFFLNEYTLTRNIIKYFIIYSLLFSFLTRFIIYLRGNYTLLGDLFSMFILVLFWLSSISNLFSLIEEMFIIAKNKKGKLYMLSTIFDNSYSFMLSYILIILFMVYFPNHSYTKNYILTTLLMLLPFKASGCFLTKTSDIIIDYKEKIEGQRKEDETQHSFSYLDNIGDIFGDLYGMFSSYLILFSMIFVNLDISQIYVLRYHIILSGGLLAFFYFTFQIISNIVGYKKSIKYIDLLFIFNILIFSTISILQKMFIFNIKFTPKNIWGLANRHLVVILLFASIAIINSIILFFNLYEYYARKIYEYSRKMLINNVIINVFVSYISTHILFYIFHLLFKLQIIYIHKRKWQIDLIFVKYFIFFSAYYILKTTFGCFADSANGIFTKEAKRKFKSTEEKEETIEFGIQEITRVSNTFEEYDNVGNIYKLESKIFLISITYIFYEFTIKSIKATIFSDFHNLFTALTIITFWYFLNQALKNYDKNNYKKHISEQVIIGGILMIEFIWSITGTASLSNNNIIMLLSGIMYYYLFLSLFFAISGSLFDISKKYVELNHNTDTKIKTEMIKADMYGDIMKDVLSPISISISYLIALTLIYLKRSI